MGSERASSVRQRYAGKICCECSSPLPPPHRRGERLCDRCGGASRKRVYMHFMFRKGWHCQFLEEDMKTLLPRTLTFADDRKIWEMAKRGGFTLNIAGRQELEAALRKGVGGIWLDLTPEQYRRLRSDDQMSVTMLNSASPITQPCLLAFGSGIRCVYSMVRRITVLPLPTG